MSNERELLTGTAHSLLLSAQYPHRPAGHQDPAQEHGKTIHAVAHHFARGIAVCDAEDDGCKQRKQKRRAEVIEGNSHCKISRNRLG